LGFADGDSGFGGGAAEVAFGENSESAGFGDAGNHVGNGGGAASGGFEGDGSTAFGGDDAKAGLGGVGKSGFAPADQPFPLVVGQMVAGGGVEASGVFAGMPSAVSPVPPSGEEVDGPSAAEASSAPGALTGAFGGEAFAERAKEAAAAGGEAVHEQRFEDEGVDEAEQEITAEAIRNGRDDASSALEHGRAGSSRGDADEPAASSEYGAADQSQDIVQEGGETGAERDGSVGERSDDDENMAAAVEASVNDASPSEVSGRERSASVDMAGTAPTRQRANEAAQRYGSLPMSHSMPPGHLMLAAPSATLGLGSGSGDGLSGPGHFNIMVVESVHASFQGPQLKRYSIVGEVRLIPLSASSPEVDFCFRFDGEKAGLVKAATPNAKFTEPIGEAGHDSSASSEAAFRVHVPPRSGEGASAGRAPIPLLRYSVAPTCRPIPLRLLPSWSRRQAPRPSVGVDGNGLGTPDDHALPPPVAALDLRLAANPSLAEGLSHVRVQATPPDGGRARECT